MFPNPPVNGIPYGDTYYDPFWAEVEDMDIPIGIHVSSTPKFMGHDLYSGSFTHNLWWYGLMQKLDCQLAFTTFFQGKVFDRFPRLKLGGGRGALWLVACLAGCHGLCDEERTIC